jgi:hypothetical protein
MTGKTRLYDRIDTKFGQGGIGVHPVGTPRGHQGPAAVGPAHSRYSRTAVPRFAGRVVAVCLFRVFSPGRIILGAARSGTNCRRLCMAINY